MAPPGAARPPLTHFLCLPLITAASRPQLSQSLASFTADVAAPPPMGFGVPPEAVRPVGTMHLTLGVMSLGGEEALGRAVALLRSLRLKEMLLESGSRAPRMPGEMEAKVEGKGKCSEEGEKGKGQEEKGTVLSVSLRGLHSMQPQASKASVLYARPVDDRRGPLFLQRFCEDLRDRFMEAGFIVDDGRPLLLHATVVNTIYAKKGGRGGGKRWDKKVTIDARGILDRYGDDDQVWMRDVAIERVVICRMGAKKVVLEGIEDAEYEVEAEVEI